MKHNLAFPALLLAIALVGLIITAGCIGTTTTTTTTPGTSFPAPETAVLPPNFRPVSIPSQ